MSSEEKMTILIVDDNPVNCKVLVDSLSQFEDYRLLVAHNGSRAIAVAEKALPDLILLDINMPEKNGFEVCQHLKGQPETAHIPIIFLSALDDVESKVKGFTLGGVDYVTKPFFQEEVIKRVETQLKLQYMTRSLQKSNESLELKNEELSRILNELLQMQIALEQSHGQITESIEYARRIQTAILPQLQSMDWILPKSFVIYMPRNIVSGDFYWFGFLDGRTILAAVDCTGHGVPGALMSVIGYTQLHSIVYENKLLEPAQILTELDNRVRKILKQDDDQEINDGMDMALCVLHQDKKLLEFSGANSPVFIVRNGEIAEVKGSPNPIGGSQFENKVYESNLIQLQPGDRVFLFSDGYFDQFGGERNRKMTRRRFKEFILESTFYPIKEQKNRLENFLIEWRGENEQTDDILVIGFEV